MIAATLITGLPGAGKTRLIEAWREACAPDQACAVLSNGTPGLFSAGRHREGWPARAPRVGLQRRPPTVQAQRSEPAWRETLSGCLCCTARAALPAALGRLIARGPWDHLLIELNGAAHPAPFIDLLLEPAIARAVRLVDVVAVIDAALPLSGSTRALELLGEQVATADRIWLRGPLSAVSEDSWSERFRAWRVFHDLPEIWRSEMPPTRPAPRVVQDQSRVFRSSRSGSWQRPASDIYDRRALAALFGRVSAEGLFERLTAVFRTERDWYAWQGPAEVASSDAWRPTLFRASNRIEFELAADGPFDDGARERLLNWLSAIAACRISGA